MNFMLVGRVYYEGGCGNPDCCGKTCQDINEKFEEHGVIEAVGKVKEILKQKVAPNYSKLEVALLPGEVLWTLESSPGLGDLEHYTIYSNLLG